MEQHQFSELINKIDEYLAKSNISRADKAKLLKAKAYLLSPSKIDWQKGIIILGNVITRADTLFNLLEKMWDWLRNLF
jgi:hypothetical protein